MSRHAVDSLIQAALSVRERAYAPYSDFKVGAAIRDENGAVHTGANVENAAFPLSQCAEASAIGAMIAAGGREIREIAVVGRGNALCTPCGGCRQRIREFATPLTPVHVRRGQGASKDIRPGRAVARIVSVPGISSDQVARAR